MSARGQYLLDRKCPKCTSRDLSFSTGVTNINCESTKLCLVGMDGRVIFVVLNR